MTEENTVQVHGESEGRRGNVSAQGDVLNESVWEVQRLFTVEESPRKRIMWL